MQPVTEGKVTLPVSEALRKSGETVLMVQLGELPAGARITVATADGIVLGAIAPFGATERKTLAKHPIPIPEELRGREKLELVFTVEERRTHDKRVPQKNEVLGVDLKAADTHR